MSESYYNEEFLSSFLMDLDDAKLLEIIEDEVIQPIRSNLPFPKLSTDNKTDSSPTITSSTRKACIQAAWITYQFYHTNLLSVRNYNLIWLLCNWVLRLHNIPFPISLYTSSDDKNEYLKAINFKDCSLLAKLISAKLAKALRVFNDR